MYARVIIVVLTSASQGRWGPRIGVVMGEGVGGDFVRQLK
jgi:hypothetical protein